MSTITYTDYKATLIIANQISLTTSSTDKLNLRFVPAFDYIQRFNLIIKHKFERFHLIFNALLRLSNKRMKKSLCQFKYENENELNVLFIAALVDINLDFKRKLIQNYAKKPTKLKINKILNSNDKNHIEFSFIQNNDFIYRKEINDNVSFVLQRLCISSSFVKNILNMIHDDNHSSFDKMYHQAIYS